MAETGRYKKIIDKLEKKKLFHQLACLVKAGHFKNPLEQEVRDNFHQSQGGGGEFKWPTSTIPDGVEDLNELFDIAATLASEDANERPIQERFYAILSALSAATT